MEPSAVAPSELAQLLELVATALPPETHPLVLRHLPTVELARLSCVHKALHVAWMSLQGQHEGKRYAPPTAYDLQRVQGRSRLERAAYLGDVAVIRTMVAAGVDEHGTPLLEAKGPYKRRIVDTILWWAAKCGHLHAVEVLLGSGANVHANNDLALTSASESGHAEVVQLLIQHGANVHARNDWALQWASENGRLAVVQLLIQNGSDVHAADDRALRLASGNGHTAVVQLLIQYGANVHAGYDNALQLASLNGHTAVVQLLIQHGADVHASDNLALQYATARRRTAVAELLIQHGARLPNS